MEQAVLISIGLSDPHLGSEIERKALVALGDYLGKQVEKAGVGEFDGDEVGDGQFRLFFYGPSADRLFDCIKPGLIKLRRPGSVVATKRYGKPGAKETKVRFKLEGSS